MNLSNPGGNFKGEIYCWLKNDSLFHNNKRHLEKLLPRTTANSLCHRIEINTINITVFWSILMHFFCFYCSRFFSIVS